MIKEFPNEVLLGVFSCLPTSDQKSVRHLSKSWSVAAAKHVFDEIRMDLSDRTMVLLEALSIYTHLRAIPPRLQVEVARIGWDGVVSP